MYLYGGADFSKSKVKVYDYSGATPNLAEYAGGTDQPMYLASAADYGRQYGLSLTNVLVASVLRQELLNYLNCLILSRERSIQHL